MVIKNVSEEVMEIFDVTGFSDILTIEQLKRAHIHNQDVGLFFSYYSFGLSTTEQVIEPVALSVVLTVTMQLPAGIS